MSTVRFTTLFAGLSCLLFFSVSCEGQSPKKSSSSGKPPATKSASAAQLQVVIKNVYAKSPGVFDIDIKVVQGKLKLGEEVDIVNAAGTRYTFTITGLRTPYEEVKELKESESTNYAMVKGPADARFDADFVMVAKGGSSSSASTSSSAKFTGSVNNKPWKGKDSYGSFSWLKKGSKMMNINKPFMQLAFKSMDAVDNRQLTIWIFTADAKPGNYSGEKIEVLLSGSPTGDSKNPELWGYKYPANKNTPLTIEITSMKEAGNGKVILSGKISGSLVKPLSGSGALPVSGEFSNIQVDVYETGQ